MCMARNKNITTEPGTIVYEVKRTRRAKVNVYVEYAPDADEAQPWLDVCATHGGVCSHETRAAAESFAHAPEEWCEDCTDVVFGEDR